MLHPSGLAIPVDPDGNVVDDPADPHMSANGRYVVFTARHLPGDRGDGYGRTVYRADLSTGSVLRVENEAAAPSISDDGRYVTYQVRDQEEPTQVWVWDGLTRDQTLISRSGDADGNGDSTRPAISGDGSVIGFTTEASNLGPHKTFDSEVVVWERGSNSVALVSQLAPGASGGSGGSYLESADAVSADGRFVAFESSANVGKLVGAAVSDGDISQTDVLVRDRVKGTTRVGSLNPSASTCRGDSQQGAAADSGSVIFVSTCRDLDRHASDAVGVDVWTSAPDGPRWT